MMLLYVVVLVLVLTKIECFNSGINSRIDHHHHYNNQHQQQQPLTKGVNSDIIRGNTTTITITITTTITTITDTITTTRRTIS